MLALPHLTAAEVDNLVDVLRRHRRAAVAVQAAADAAARLPAGSGAPPELIAGSGSAWTRPETPGRRARTRSRRRILKARPNTTRYTINEYNTVGNRIKPPFTTIVKYDLNQPAIKWRIPYGDDPALAARGITGTGAPGIINSLIVTQSGLVFGAGRDNQIRAWDSETGKQLWSSRFGGSFLEFARDVRDGRHAVPAGSCSRLERTQAAVPGRQRRRQVVRPVQRTQRCRWGGWRIPCHRNKERAVQ